MSKNKKKLDFGRLFFPKQEEKLIDFILFQPLGNHVSNVTKLVNYWREKDFFDRESRHRVSEASRLHDMGKPQKFSASIDINKKGKVKFSYSFKGHRFLAEKPEDLWIELLAQGHHDYSVNDICRDTYKIKNWIFNLAENSPFYGKAQQYQHILYLDSLTYAKELYILEMCDQIEAEIACRFFEDDDQAESRAFMDFNIIKHSKNEFLLEPWIFEKEEIKLPLAYWKMSISQEFKQEIENSSLEDSVKLTKKLNSLIKDWWNSQDKNVKSAVEIVTLKPLIKEAEKKLDCLQLYQDICHFSPNPMQQDLINALSSENPAIILKASTGTGKLEAILIPALANDYKLFLLLPSRSLLEDHFQRIERYLLEFSKLPINRNRDLSLVIDTGAEMTRFIYKNGDKHKPKNNPKRHLYKGNIILSTLDKFMYRYFSYGDKQKSFIFPHRINQEKSLICFDEAHSYDNLAFTNFCNLIQALYEAGRNLVLMTATLPEKHLQRFNYLKDELIDYIDNKNNKEKLDKFLEQNLKQTYPNQKILHWKSEIKIQELEEKKEDNNFQQEFTNIILNEWKSDQNNRIIAVVETVKDAVAIYQQVKEKLNTNSDDEGRFLFLYHGRISDTPKDENDKDYQYSRSGIYRQIKQRDDGQKPYLIITTSAIEVGCDLNCKTLITQFCPPENLIQRAGRCNRKGNIANAKIIIIGDSIPNFLNTNTLTDDELKLYKIQLQQLHNQNFNAKKIMECVSQTQQVDDYRIVELFSQLQDYVYQADLTCKPTHEKGLVITRSWIPSATLIYDDGSYGNHTHKMPQITVPLDRLIIKSDSEIEKTNQYANVTVEESYYEQETTSWKTRTIRWGNAYQKNIIIKINKTQDGANYFDGFSEYDYNPEFGFVDLPGVFVKWKPKNFEQQLAYKEGDKTLAVINYITPNND